MGELWWWLTVLCCDIQLWRQWVLTRGHRDVCKAAGLLLDPDRNHTVNLRPSRCRVQISANQHFSPTNGFVFSSFLVRDHSVLLTLVFSMGLWASENLVSLNIPLLWTVRNVCRSGFYFRYFYVTYITCNFVLFFQYALHISYQLYHLGCCSQHTVFLGICKL